LFELEKEKWKYMLVRDQSVRGNCGNKLKTYGLLKSDFETENYLFKTIPFQYRSAYTKLRCGVALIRLETGRYENLPLDRRFCFNCEGVVEDEKYVLF
jgi:hypothetical protein